MREDLISLLRGCHVDVDNDFDLVTVVEQDPLLISVELRFVL